MRKSLILLPLVIWLMGMAVTPVAFGEFDAVTRARYDLRLGFTVGGQVSKVHVKPGDVVKADDPLVELEDKEGLAQIAIWKFRSESEVAIDANKAQLELAALEEKRISEIVKKGAAHPIELTRAAIQTRVAKLNVEQARMEQQEAERQLEIYEARHERYILRAKLDGTIDQVTVEAGEMVEDLKPILRLVVRDKLRVDVAVPVADTLGVKVGDSAWVTAKIPGYDKPIKGKILHKALVADSASDTLIIQVELDNKLGLPAGVQVSVSFKPPGPVAAAPSN